MRCCIRRLSLFCIFLQNGDIFCHYLVSLLREGSRNRRLKNRSIESEISCEDTKKICILILVLDQWRYDDIVRTKCRIVCLDFFYPFLVRDEDSSFFECGEIRGDIFLIEGDEDVYRLREVWLLTTDMHIIIIEPSLDDRLIF